MKGQFHRLKYAASSLLIATVAFSVPALAEDAPIHIGVVNPSRVFHNLTEMTDLRKKEAGELAQLRDQEQARKKDLQDMVDRRDKFTKQGTDDYQKQTRQIMEKTLEDRNWADFQQAQLTMDNKQHMLDMFAKVEAAVGEIAKDRRLDLVVADQGLDLTADDLEKLSADQVNQLLHQRNVIYATKSIDITDDVTARLNNNYKATGGTAPAQAPGGK
jgi:Skp family chaperone for outer membrane proteins